MSKINSPNITAFLETLRRKNINYIPLAELGVHPKIKELFLSKKINGLEDEVDFWEKAGYAPSTVNGFHKVSYRCDSTSVRMLERKSRLGMIAFSVLSTLIGSTAWISWLLFS